MELFPDFSTVLRIGNYSIHWYSVTMMIGIIAVYLMMSKKIKEETGYDVDFFDNLAFSFVIIGIIGARLWYVTFYPNNSYYFNNPINILKIWEGGLAMQGVIFAISLYLLVVSRKHKIDVLRFFDIAMPTALIGQAIGRWGNFFNQEAYGPIVDESYFRFFPEFIKQGMFINGAYRMPTFLLEGIFNVIGYFLIYTLLKKTLIKKRGDYGYAYLWWTGIVRFVIEIYRTDNLLVFGLKSAQMASIVYVLIAILGFSGVIDKIFKKPKPVILFDLDGTVTDSRKVIEDSFRELVKKYQPKRKLGEEELDSYIGPPLKELLNRILPDEDQEKIFREYKEINTKLLKKNLKPCPHAKELLAYLKDEGYQIGIVSNRLEESIKICLEVTGLKDYVDVTVGIDNVNKAKPDKESIIKACKELKRGIDEIVMVGDSEEDINCAIAAGAFAVTYCSYLPRKEALLATKPNRYIEDLSELREILKEKHSWTYNMM